MKAEIAAARSRLRKASSVLVVSHIRPDGDAIGSLLGLTLALRNTGRRVTSLLADGLPGRFAFLPGADRVVAAPDGPADLVVAVDCSSDERMGLALDSIGGRVDLNIDHHVTNTRFADVNIVRPDAAATAEILYELAPRFGLMVDEGVATCLLTGLVTDTIGFRTSNVTPAVLRLAAELVDRGAPLAEVYDRGLNRRALAAARYWGSGLVKLERRNGLVWTTLTHQDRLRSGYPGLDDADLINLVSAIEEAEVALIFIEQPGAKVKVSWRSRAPVDVAQIAAQFGGGGHAPAAGAVIAGTIDQVAELVLEATAAYLTQVRSAAA